MSNEDGYMIAEQYTVIDKAGKGIGFNIIFSFYDSIFYGFTGDTSFEAE